MNTEQKVDDPKLAQTTFWLDSHEDFRYMEGFWLHLDHRGHEPTPEEDSLAPFYQDPSQRMLVLGFRQDIYVYVMKAEVLLKLARERRGAGLVWGEWRTHVVEVILSFGTASLWVSGPRLFSLRLPKRRSGEWSWVDVYDLSPRAPVRHTEEAADNDERVMRTMVPNLGGYELSLRANMIQFAHGGHDSIVFLEVNALSPNA